MRVHRVFNIWMGERDKGVSNPVFSVLVTSVVRPCIWRGFSPGTEVGHGGRLLQKARDPVLHCRESLLLGDQLAAYAPTTCGG